jgi:hypothetical protein
VAGNVGATRKDAQRFDWVDRHNARFEIGFHPLRWVCIWNLTADSIARAAGKTMRDAIDHAMDGEETTVAPMRPVH